MKQEEIQFIKDEVLPKLDSIVWDALSGNSSRQEAADSMNEVFDKARPQLEQMRDAPNAEE